ncbi:hypothetical protein BO71DRAFT_38654 [Aspergillus ellipticus CBS 707.79]|uniref:Uncharacterized protein n=1 Tax=Aspergillus ellipticus CBS 707.79 TaxID=1448320 RepID=A0A319DBZ9_9EURO|nr:hypothetical protein BO71DRAFT_38654 [Aspergillus ellipticus CBS 707.79]
MTRPTRLPCGKTPVRRIFERLSCFIYPAGLLGCVSGSTITQLLFVVGPLDMPGPRMEALACPRPSPLPAR